MSEIRSKAERNPRGLIYIVQNDMHPDDVFKVGQTYRTVEQRLDELNRETGNPGTFSIRASFPVDDRHGAEKAAHRQLKDAGLHHKNEFFRGNWAQILQIVEEATSQFEVRRVINAPENVSQASDQETLVDEILRKGRYYNLDGVAKGTAQITKDPPNKTETTIYGAIFSFFWLSVFILIFLVVFTSWVGS